MVLYVGCGVRNINPPLNTPMGGYWLRDSGVQSIHDDLSVRVLILSNLPTLNVANSNSAGQSSAFCLVTMDLIGLDHSTALGIRKAIGELNLGGKDYLSLRNIMISTTHTHNGPATHSNMIGMGHAPLSYMNEIKAATLDAVSQAAASLQQATINYVMVDDLDLAVNRRERIKPDEVPDKAANNVWETSGRTRIGTRADGPVVRHAHVIQFVAMDTVKQTKTTSPLIATLCNYACHPVATGRQSILSADFVGVARQRVEECTHAPCLYLTGACADLNPRIPERSLAKAEELGNALGNAIIRASAKSTGIDTKAILVSDRYVIELPLQPLPSVTEAQHLVETQREWLQFIQNKHPNSSQLHTPEATVKYAETLLHLCKDNSNKESIDFEIQALRISSLMIVGFEGELFCEYQLRLENYCAQRFNILVSTLSNGCVGYIPTAEEFAEGGYEVDVAYRVYGHYQTLKNTCDDIIMKATIKMLDQLSDQTNKSLLDS